VRGLALFLPAAWELFFGATLILLFALLLNFGLRNRAAALRHRIWGLSAIGLLLLPLLCPLLPKLPLKLDIPIAGTHSLPVVLEDSKEPVALPPSRIDAEKDFPSLSTMPRTNRSIPLAPSTASPETKAIAADSGLQTSSSATAEQARLSSGGPSFWLKSCSVLMFLWLVGILWGLMATVRSVWVSRRLRRDAVPLADLSWQKLFEELRGQLDVRRTVSLGVGKRTIFPLCIGFWKPAILLPADCIEWTPEKRRAVLVHELSHVARNDVFWQIAAQLACILFWIHPLAWLAARRMRIERERACDDAVLLFGGQAAEYASILLDVAATICGRHAKCGTAAVAMACRKPVEQRIRAILQPGLSRLPVGSRMAKVLLIGTMTLVALTAALHPFSAQRQTQANDVVVKEKVASTSSIKYMPVV
jgi:beta-lactamase regulating signal transducer with metallopeptidase domain